VRFGASLLCFSAACNLFVMKALVALVLILLVLLVALPIGMSGMGDCPACASSTGTFALGFCAGILSLAALTIHLTGMRFRAAAAAVPSFLLARFIFRPPRLA
jgi:hypothetical protein